MDTSNKQFTFTNVGDFQTPLRHIVGISQNGYL